jgi:hypothetical protein
MPFQNRQFRVQNGVVQRGHNLANAAAYVLHRFAAHKYDGGFKTAALLM